MHVGQPNDRFPVRAILACARTYVHLRAYGNEAALVSDKSKYFTGYESSRAGKMFARRLGAAFQYVAPESYTYEPRAVQYHPSV